MSYSVKYRINFIDQEGINCGIDIEKKSYSGGITTVTAGPNPFILSYRNGSDDIYEPIRASEATIQVIDTNISIDDLKSTADDDFRIHFYQYYTGGSPTTVWKGLISQDDLNVAYQYTPNVIEFKAVDGLGFLDKVNFTVTGLSSDGLVTKHRLSSIIGKCLENTYLDIQYRIFSNIFENSASDRTVNAYNCAFYDTYLDPYTFSVNEDEFVSCLQVIKIILSGFNATIFQSGGEWCILRVQEFVEGKNLSSTFYEADGTRQTFDTTSNREHLVTIGATGDLKYVNADQLIRLIRPSKKERTEFYWDIFKEVPKNSRWLNGTVQSSPESGLPVYDAISLDYWTQRGCTKYFYRRYYSAGTTASDNYLYLKWDGSTNILQNILFSSLSEGTYVGLRATPFSVSKTDKCKVSFDQRWGGSEPSYTSWNAQSRCAMLMLKETGTSNVYFYSDNNAWVKNKRYVLSQFHYGGFDQLTDWKTLDVETSPFPVDGELYVFLLVEPNVNYVSYLLGREIHFRNFKFTYIPAEAIGKGEYWQLSQNGNISNENTHEIKINDTRIPVAKGTMFLSGGARTDLWGYSGETKNKRFIQLNARGHYRGNHRYKRFLEGSFQGVRYLDPDSADYTPISILNRFKCSDLGGQKRFMATSLEINYKTQILNGVFTEVYDSATTDATTTGDSEVNGYIY